MFTTLLGIAPQFNSSKKQQSKAKGRTNETEGSKDIMHQLLHQPVPLQQIRTLVKSQHVKFIKTLTRMTDNTNKGDGQEENITDFSKHSKFMVKSGKKCNNMSLLGVQHKPDHTPKSSLENLRSEP